MKTRQHSKNLYLRIRPKRPTAFSIYDRIELNDGRTKNETLPNIDLDSLNKAYAQNKVTLIESTKQAKSILKQLKVSQNIQDGLEDVFNSENEKILKLFLEDYFKRKRFLVDKDSARYKFERAVKAVGKMSLYTSSEEDLLSCILELDFDENKKRDIVAKLNSILKFLKRDVVIPSPPKVVNEVLFLTENEVLKVSEHLKDETLKHLCLLSFYSGLRIGECLAVKESSLKSEGIILIEHQIDKAGKKRLPKNRKQRKAFLIENGLESFNYWIKHKEEFEASRNIINKRFRVACRRVFKSKDKHCKWHDLRHSYAVHLIGKGIPIQLVAQSMGNSIKVCEEYYSGFILTDIGINTIKSLLK